MEDKDKIIAELKAENEQLKALCDTYRTCYQAKHSDIKCLFIKYKQTLQEIKAVAENNCCMTDKDFCSSNSCTVCKSVSDADVIKQILQLITKAEEE